MSINQDDQGRRQKIRLGDLLVEQGIITAEQLAKALAEQKKTGIKLGKMLISLGYIDERGLMSFLAEQLRIPSVDLRRYQLKPELVKKLPETFARRYRAILLREEAGNYLLGLSDPTDLFAQDKISRHLKAPVSVAVVSEADLLSSFNSLYRRTDEISTIAEELGEELSQSEFDLARLATGTDVSEAPVVRLLQSLFEDAIQVKASDIHIEPDENLLRLRQRIDGVLHEQVMREKRIAPALVSRLKLMAGLNISERRLPQDGRFNIRVQDHHIDVRLSTMPTIHGESVVMRLLDHSHGMVTLESTGMPAELIKRFRRIIHKPHGMVLVTGPTGSGKTTTLYAALSELNNAERKIITIEDPVEYRLPRINQVQTNGGIGLGFAEVLRTALRQDPDVILIGEMRDRETAEIGLRAAMTGHMVLSTLHTNDAVSTTSRLLDMGAAGYLVASSLQAVLAQRLVRKICNNCTEAYAPEHHEKVWLQNNPMPELDVVTFKHGRGCMQCNNTGYSGRVGVFEFLELDENLADALRREDNAEFSRLARTTNAFQSLEQGALSLAMQGVITLAEVIRVAGESGLFENLSNDE